MPANVQSMAYVGEVPWHGQGNRVPPHIRSDEMIEAAELDWEVEARPARGAKSTKNSRGKETFTRYEVVRLPRRRRNEQEITLGLVSGRYQPLQNSEAFKFFDPLVDRKTATYETAGVLGEGERVWVMARMPGDIEVVRGDACQRFLLLANSHTGKGSVIVKFTAVRVVCQNTLTMAMEDGQSAFRVRHSAKVNQRLEEVAELISAANHIYRQAAERFRLLAATKIRDKKMLENYLAALFPKTEAQKERGTHSPKWDHVINLFETAPDLQIPGVKGTMWAAYNAVTRFEDYREVKDESNANRLNRVWFGAGADLKINALTEATRVATNN
jgi:phage/plasmid-like protein (TIGR03299 family)